MTNKDSSGFPEPPKGPSRDSGSSADGAWWQSGPAGPGAAGGWSRPPGGPGMDGATLTGTLPWERNYALAVHLSMIASICMLPVIPALVLWLIKKNESAFINQQAKEAINAQISWLIYIICCMALAVVFIIGTMGFAFCLFLPLILALQIVPIVHAVQGAIAANRGEAYAYPMILRLL